jgi:hypothetical protein
LRVNTLVGLLVGEGRDVADGCDDGARIGGIKVEFRGAGVIVFVENLAPGFASVGGFENAAGFAGGKSAGDGDVDKIGVVRIDQERGKDGGIAEA